MLLLLCLHGTLPAQDVNAKATTLRTPFKEKYLVKDLTLIRDHGPEDAHFDVVFRFARFRV